jgi:hypothetical protein
LVTNKFVGKSKKMPLCIVLSNGQLIVIHSEAGWDFLNIEDSIFKKAGSLEYVIKPKGGLPKSFYPKCDGHEIR